jgi:hypothetical protein
VTATNFASGDEAAREVLVLRWIIGGLVGGGIGAAIWVAVGYTTNYEVGWIAWGIGFLTGLGVRLAAHQADQEESAGQGIFAAALAVLCILGAKYAVFDLVVGSQMREAESLISQNEITDEDLIRHRVDATTKEMTDRGERVNWPPGIDYESATEKEHYPVELWQKAEAEWNQLPLEERETLKKEEQEAMNQFLAALPRPSFADTFSPWDLLWFGLALFTAFRIGVGSYGND